MMSFFIVALSIALGCVYSASAHMRHPLHSHFKAWKVEHEKTYETSEEEERRFQTFVENHKRVVELQEDSSLTWTAGHTILSDMTWEEVKQTRLMKDQDCSATHVSSTPSDIKEAKKIEHTYPPSMDWRSYGILAPVKDQGNCGSCWAFSSVASVEAHTALKNYRKKLASGEINTGEVVSFSMLADTMSEQELLDCSSSHNNHGCNGGLPSHAFSWLKESGGLETEKDYPYLERTTSHHKKHTCALKKEKIEGVVPQGSVNITAFDEQELFAAVATKGPVSVAFDCTNDLQFYKGGVFQSDKCKQDKKSVNHAVVAVGYGVENGLEYWLIRNSWSNKWGEMGYFKMLRNGPNTCGIADCPAYPGVYPPEKDIVSIS